MDDTLQKVINLIEASDLDQTIKDILIRDLKTDGLTDFLCEQIMAYCVEGLKQMNADTAEAKKILEEHSTVSQNPA